MRGKTVAQTAPWRQNGERACNTKKSIDGRTLDMWRNTADKKEKKNEMQLQIENRKLHFNICIY